MAEKNVGKLAMAGYESWMGPSTVDKWQTLPPKTPPEYVKAYRDAFEKAVHDPEFLKIARAQFSIDLTSMTGKTLEKRIVQIVGCAQGSPRLRVEAAQEVRRSRALIHWCFSTSLRHARDERLGTHGPRLS